MVEFCAFGANHSHSQDCYESFAILDQRHPITGSPNSVEFVPDVT